jgi:hypothetical protein
MGVRGRQESAEAVRPQRAEIGTWVTGLAAEFPFLSRNDIIGLAGMRALLAVDTGLATSTYIAAGKHSASEISNASTHSLLRSNVIVASGAILLSCGAPKPDFTFVTDWQLRCTTDEAGAALVDVTQHKTTNGQLSEGWLMVSLREALTQTLACGIHLHLGDGPPSTDGLVVNMPSGSGEYPRDGNSPFGYDRIGGLGDAYREPLALPASARDNVLQAIAAGYFRSGPGPGEILRTASLAGGRPFDSGSVALRRETDADQLVIDIPAALDPTERERSYRAALRCLTDIAAHLKDTEPDISAAITAHVERIASDTHDAWTSAAGAPQKKRRPGYWVKNWDATTAAPMVPVAAHRWYPVGIRITTSAQESYLVRAMQASDWVTAYKRTHAILLPNGRPSGRRGYSSRRSGLLTSSTGAALPFLRYVWMPDTRDHLVIRATSPNPWFWEVNTRAVPPGDAPADAGGLLMVTGWSHADGVIGYGENLLSLLRAFAEVISATDGRARIQTLYLAT